VSNLNYLLCIHSLLFDLKYVRQIKKWAAILLIWSANGWWPTVIFILGGAMEADTNTHMYTNVVEKNFKKPGTYNWLACSWYKSHNYVLFYEWQYYSTYVHVYENLTLIVMKVTILEALQWNIIFSPYLIGLRPTTSSPFPRNATSNLVWLPSSFSL